MVLGYIGLIEHDLWNDLTLSNSVFGHIGLGGWNDLDFTNLAKTWFGNDLTFTNGGLGRVGLCQNMHRCNLMFAKTSAWE